MGDSMNKWKIFILCIVACLLAIPAVSAEEEYVINSVTEETLAFAEKDYIVSPWTENSPDSENSIFSLWSTQYISQGQTIIHNVNVGLGVNYIEADLNWGDISESLTLSI